MQYRNGYYSLARRRAQSYDQYTQADKHYEQFARQKRFARPPPILIFVGGGGWQGVDHVNSHADIAATAVQVGYVAVVLRHRPVAVSALGAVVMTTPAVLVCLSAAVGSLSVAVLRLYMLAMLAITVACHLLNWVRDAASMPDVVQDCARGVAAVHRSHAHGGGVVGDATRLVFMGSSSGGHLLSLLACDRRWLDALGVPRAHLRACIDVGGIPSLSDTILSPARLLITAFLLGFDFAAARELSPQGCQARGALNLDHISMAWY